MKTTIFAVTILFALALTTVAQSSKPAVSRHLAGDASAGSQFQNNALPAAKIGLCSPCIFYGGDLNPDDINAAGMSDENTLVIEGGSGTYGAVIFPDRAYVNGIIFNVQASDAFDPKTATYDIREGVSDGYGGSVLQSGSSNIQILSTGRNFLGFYEYSIAVHFPTVTLDPGVEYWFNVEPQCLNGATDGSCYQGRFFVSNTTQGTNNENGNYQPKHEMFLNSSFFGITWANWCDSFLGFNRKQCDLLSYGLVGTVSE
ncbi:MAG TPA: hypothetical protein VMU61_14890 [Candidatus Aquilonibacter sp.]|nr:hypothetical protein [Candidatus Aquilonibacter sp.]